MKKDAKIKKDEYVKSVVGLVLLFLCLPFLLPAALIMGLRSAVGALIKHPKHLLLGTKSFYKKTSTCAKNEIPQIFHHLIKGELIEDDISVSYPDDKSCSCGNAPDKYTANESEGLLKNFIHYYDALDRNHSIAIIFDVNFKRMKEIDNDYIAAVLLPFCRNAAQKRHIIEMHRRHSERRIGRCQISYCNDGTFHIVYDGHECGYRAMLEGAQDNIN